MSITGVPEGQPGAGASLVGYSVSDITAGYYATIAILAALNHRDRVSGQGQHIDLALLDAQVHAASHIAMNYLVSGKMPVRAGTSSQTICPWQAFDCADMPLMLAVGTDQQFARLCETIGPARLAADARFLTNRKRMENKPALIPVLAERFKTRTAREWMDALHAVGVAERPDQRFRPGVRRPAGASIARCCGRFLTRSRGRYGSSPIRCASPTRRSNMAAGRRCSASTPPRCCGTC